MVYDNPVTGVRRYRMERLELPQGLLLEFVTDLMTQHPTGCLRVAESTLTPFVPERSDLNATIAVAEALTEGDYTAETWAALVDALEKARTVAADEAATQTQVDDAATGLALPFRRWQRPISTQIQNWWAKKKPPAPRAATPAMRFVLIAARL